MADVALERMAWYRNIFNDLNHDWEAIVDARDTEKEAAFIEGVLGNKRTVLDLCCGTGRHSVILSRYGWNIIGLDLSRNLLAIAKVKMREKAAGFPLVRADMRCIPFRNQTFSAVINMFTSFGYLPSEREDLKCLSDVKRVLKKNGNFLLDVVNRDYVTTIYKERDWAEYKPFFLLENRALDLSKSMLLSEWTIIRKNTNEVSQVQHNLRLYSRRKLSQMLGRAGLQIKQVFGGYDRKKFGRSASRMILLTQKMQTDSASN